LVQAAAQLAGPILFAPITIWSRWMQHNWPRGRMFDPTLKHEKTYCALTKRSCSPK
jgi:hypothetical protein